MPNPQMFSTVDTSALLEGWIEKEGAWISPYRPHYLKITKMGTLESYHRRCERSMLECSVCIRTRGISPKLPVELPIPCAYSQTTSGRGSMWVPLGNCLVGSG